MSQITRRRTWFRRRARVSVHGQRRCWSSDGFVLPRTEPALLHPLSGTQGCGGTTPMQHRWGARCSPSRALWGSPIAPPAAPGTRIEGSGCCLAAGARTRAAFLSLLSRHFFSFWVANNPQQIGARHQTKQHVTGGVCTGLDRSTVHIGLQQTNQQDDHVPGVVAETPA